MAKRISSEEIERAKALYAEGLTLADVGQRIGRSTKAIWRALRGAGVAMQPRHAFQPGHQHSAETREKMAAARRGKLHSAEARAKIAAARRGQQISAETRAKLELQGLTGTAAVALAGGGGSSPPLSLPAKGELPEIVAERSEFQNLLESAQTIARRTDEVLGKLDALMTVNQGGINNTVRNVERFTGALADNGEALAEAIRNAGELTNKLNASADRLDSVLKSIDQFVGSPEAKGTLGEFADTAKAFRDLAQNLDKRTAELTAGVGRVTGAGMRELESLTTEGRRTLGELNRVLRDLERNPQQLLFGSKPALPQYNGRH